MTRSEQRRSTKRRSRILRIGFDCSSNSSRIGLLFSMFFWHLFGEKVSEKQKGKKNKTKNTFPIILLCFLFFPFSSFLGFHSFFLSLSVAFSLSFSCFFLFSLTFWAKKYHQTQKIENHEKTLKHHKSPKFSKMPNNPVKIGVAKKKIIKHLKTLRK